MKTLVLAIMCFAVILFIVVQKLSILTINGDDENTSSASLSNQTESSDEVIASEGVESAQRIRRSTIKRTSNEELINISKKLLDDKDIAEACRCAAIVLDRDPLNEDIRKHFFVEDDPKLGPVVWGPAVVITESRIEMPVFSTRRVKKKVDIWYPEEKQLTEQGAAPDGE